jgi:hypothetical protein
MNFRDLMTAEYGVIGRQQSFGNGGAMAFLQIS